MLRFATIDDTDAILAIYRQYIDASVTFEYVLPTRDEFRTRIESISREYPYLVWEEDGRILGYAYAHRYRERAAYQWGAELSVYLHRDTRGRGIGTRLYAALLELLKLMDIRAAYGVVTHPNEDSDRLHLSMGFTVAGIVHKAGYKAGSWRDVTTYEKLIGDFSGPPAPPKTVRELDPATVRGILEENHEGCFQEKDHSFSQWL